MINLKYKETVKDELSSTDFIRSADPRLPDPEMEIKLRPGSIPTYNPRVRQVAKPFEESSREVLQRMLDNDIIEPLKDRITSWCSPMHFVGKKNGKCGMVVDLRDLNKCVDRPHHPFPGSEEIRTSIRPDSKFFAVLDLSDGYSQIKLHKNSRHLTCFMTPQGRMMFKRMPQGFSPSSDLFNIITDEIFRTMDPRTYKKVVDDVLLQSATMEGLLALIDQFLSLCKSVGMIVSAKKMSVGTTVQFCGFEI